MDHSCHGTLNSRCAPRHGIGFTRRTLASSQHHGYGENLLLRLPAVGDNAAMQTEPPEAEPPIALRPIGFVHSPRCEVSDDFWGDVIAVVELADDLPPDSLDGLEEFSHSEIIYLFDRVAPDDVVSGVRHPRNNPGWPLVGIFAQRAKGRPNRLGSTIVRIVGRDCRQLQVLGLDAVDGTPVLDIKPVMAEFLPREPIHQPEWSRELMQDYWRSASERPRPS